MDRLWLESMTMRPKHVGCCRRPSRARLPLRLHMLALAATLLASHACAQVQFAALLPRCAATCEPPKRCALVSGAITCRDGCWANRCPTHQLCVHKSCSGTGPGAACGHTVTCVDVAELSLSVAHSDTIIGGEEDAVLDGMQPSEATPQDPMSTPDTGPRQCDPNDPNTCERFQQCVPVPPGYRCGDVCDPARCPLGRSCQLEPAPCSSPPCLRVAVCV